MSLLKTEISLFPVEALKNPNKKRPDSSSGLDGLQGKREVLCYAQFLHNRWFMARKASNHEMLDNS